MNISFYDPMVASKPISLIRTMSQAMEEMNDDSTRKLLKIFGVTVTDFEDESRRLIGEAEKLKETRGRENIKQLAGLVESALELTSDLSKKWLEITRLVFEKQASLYQRLIETVKALKETS